MKQIVQNYRTGELNVEEVPAPICKSGEVLVRTAYSLVSTGTERMKVEQARMSLLSKAKARPDQVRKVVDSVRQIGLAESINKVRERLDALTPLGYSVSGVVEAVGPGVDAFTLGDRVACAGEAIACHAEFVSVPRNLCARVPDEVHFKDAAFATVGAIAMNGVRQAEVSLGDTVVVVGLGLVGLLGVQLLKASGCRVIGIDLDADKVALAKTCGADLALLRSDESLLETIRAATDGRGPDAAYLAASTKSADPMRLAGELLRDRGRIVIVGMMPVEADWRIYYQKELSVRMSRSYGPGRYDRNYEHRGIDYPIGYVRWTQNRNLEEFLRQVASGSVRPAQLNPTTFPLEEAPTAYQQLHDSPGRHAGGILFEYPSDAVADPRVTLEPDLPPANASPGNQVGVGLIGAGNFATATLIPALKRISTVQFRGICSARGLSAKSAARRHGFAYCASDRRELLEDESLNAVVIATRHDTHAPFTAEALRAGKHVFVEKPLAMTPAQLQDVIAARQESRAMVLPGFNRRFSPLSQAIRDFFEPRSGPIEVVCRVSAGAMEADSWYQDTHEGGWRIISEGCHFVDLIQYLCGCRPVRVFAEMIGGNQAHRNDNCSVTLRMEDGSIGTLVYVANGDTAQGKERIEVFGGGRTASIDNWKWAFLSRDGKTRKLRGNGKGHREEMQAFIEAVSVGGSAPITFDESIACTATTFAIARSLVTEQPEACTVDAVLAAHEPERSAAP